MAAVLWFEELLRPGESAIASGTGTQRRLKQLHKKQLRDMAEI